MSGDNLKEALFEDHYDKADVQPDRSFVAVCRHCAKRYKMRNNLGHGNLKSHITNKHPEKIKNDGASGSSGTSGGKN